MATSLKAVQGNTAPQYLITCDRPDGTIINLTNCTVAFFLYLNKVQVNPTTSSTSVVIQSPNTAGIIGWTPQTGDFSVKGTYKGNVVVTYSGGLVETLYNQAIFSIL